MKYSLPKENENIITCKMCSKNIEKGKNIYCNTCQGDLCGECYNIHYTKYPNHIVKLSKAYIQKDQKTLPNLNKNNCKICNRNLKNQNNSFYCNKCQGDLCISCSYNHKNMYPGHSVQIKDNINQLEDSIYKHNKNNLSMNLPLKSKGEQCNSCGVSLFNKINLSTYNCEYCDEFYCNKCINSHYNLFPDHKPKRRHHKNASQEIIPSTDIDLPYESREKCYQCQKKICKKSNEPVYYCNQCKIKLCKDCRINHNNKYSSHTIIIYSKKDDSNNNKDYNLKTEETDIKNLNNSMRSREKRETKVKDYVCFMCKLSHSKYPSRIYYTCSECKNYICSLCKKKHDAKFYSHILSNPHKFGEDENIEEDSGHRRYASVGSRNIKRVKKAKESENQTKGAQKIEKGETPNNTGKNFCLKCKKVVKLQICRKCNKYYCQKCVKDGQHKCN